MTGTPIDPGKARSVAQDTSYTYQPTAGAWSKDSALWCIDATGDLVQTTDPGALRVYNAAATKLAHASSNTSIDFVSDGVTYALYQSGSEVIAEEV